MSPHEKAEQIKAHAAKLGFDACGIADASVVDPDQWFEAWLAKGYHADMTWMERTPEIRCDIRLKLPGARSVVVVAKDYFAQRPPAASQTGLVSRYAWGRDYHEILREPVRALADTIRNLEPDTKTYLSIDTGPVLEKAWAAMAGLGWIGKNSLLIRPDAGSWCVLAVIATTVELMPDIPIANQCHACTRCIDACPTGAIVAPGVIDARRCLSYQTIENRGAIPEMLHTAMGDYVFGCDRCQEACPWNKSPHITTDPAFFPQNDAISLDEIESMTESEFTARFKGTPLYRARITGLQRNAAIIRKNLSESSKL